MSNYQEFRDDSPNEVPVRGFVHGPMVPTEIASS